MNRILAETYPDAHTELDFQNPFQLLIATVLSAQTTDVRVNLTTPQLFAGDTLFAGSIGRTDLWGGSMEQILDSLRGKLMELPEDTLVHPGHGSRTTIGEERQSNPFLLGQ